MTALVAESTEPASAVDACLHCGTPLVTRVSSSFCCLGCRAVHRLLRSQGLMRFYDLRAGQGLPVAERRRDRRDRAWLEPLVTRPPDTPPVMLDVQGMHCAGCVWLLSALFERHAGAGRIDIDPALGRVSLHMGSEFPLREWVDEIESFGYVLGPPLKRTTQRSQSMLLRVGVCIALAINAMILGVALHLGLKEEPLHTLFQRVGLGLSVLSVLVGGPLFFTSAWRALRRGVFHLDLPISVGIIASLAGTVWGVLAGRPGAVFFDTLAVFVALMVLGRWLGERVAESNRNRLLESDGLEALRTRRLVDGRPTLVPARALDVGDTLLLLPGELLPVDGVLLDARADVALDWITGESSPRTVAEGDVVPAGAFLASTSPARICANQQFEDSHLLALVSRPAPKASEDGGAHASELTQRTAGFYVLGVVGAAALGFAMWSFHDPLRGLEVATAILVVTCPCAFGIATPLGHQLAQATLRRHGLFVRRPGFLDRARRVEKLLFDKTGTLTTGHLIVAEPERLTHLPLASKQALFDLAARSAHPASQAIARALESEGLRLREDAVTQELPGLGIEGAWEKTTHRLGRPDFVDSTAQAEHSGDVCYGIGGNILLRIELSEELRPDAATELNALTKAGYELWILSGDAPARVQKIAALVGIPAERALGGLSPEDKATRVAALDDHNTLFLGDGVNDNPASDRAHAAGTPALDQPLLAARTDFYLTTPGLRPLGDALALSRRLATITRRNFAFAVVYNVGAVAIAMTGAMHPWLAAILMPASSIGVVLVTTFSLKDRGRAWT